MGKKLFSITVKGREKTWSFTTALDPKYIDDWIADGIEIYELVNTIPDWIVDLGLIRPWCFLQDIFNFKNPWKKS